MNLLHFFSRNCYLPFNNSGLLHDPMPSLLKPLTLIWIMATTVIVSSCVHLNSIEGKNHTVALPNAVALDLVWIVPGTFTMGAPSSEAGSQEWDRPQTVVAISQGFWLGKTPVTQGQYQAVMGDNPSRYVKAGLDAPVEMVSWHDAMKFCHRLTKQEQAAGRLPQGYAYTLPTEAQWEYACRAGTTGVRYGNLDDIAWYAGNSGNSTHPVGQKKPNAFGLYDMTGNVSQWCSDWYFEKLPGGNVTDPVGPDSGSFRVLRGGCWGDPPEICRSACRLANHPDLRASLFGFRLALAPSR
jgi:formylglycine-generating enzyme required for sulfatase activity